MNSPNLPCTRIKDDNADLDEFDTEDFDSSVTDDRCHLNPEIVGNLNSVDPEVRHGAMLKVHRLLRKPPKTVSIDSVIDSEILNGVIQSLGFGDSNLCEEALAILVLATGTTEHAMAVVQAQAIPALVSTFPNVSMIAKEYTLLVLGNLALWSEGFRDQVVRRGGMKPPVAVLEQPTKHTAKVVDAAAWALSSYLRPNVTLMLTYGETRDIIPTLAQFIINNIDETSEAMGYAVKTLSLTSNYPKSIRGANAMENISTGLSRAGEMSKEILLEILYDMLEDERRSVYVEAVERFSGAGGIVQLVRISKEQNTNDPFSFITDLAKTILKRHYKGAYKSPRV
ncbi:hypothetical protein FRB90_003284 [Tulasnella sp. 427]|nr:hypothetical protein FRB90_003284 [Tulasnella sp. 427]